MHFIFGDYGVFDCCRDMQDYIKLQQGECIGCVQRGSCRGSFAPVIGERYAPLLLFSMNLYILFKIMFLFGYLSERISLLFFAI